MCKHCDNFDLKSSAETALRNSVPTTPLEPAWVEKLGGIVLPLDIVSMLAGFTLMALKVGGHPVRFDPEYTWVAQFYLVALTLTNMLFWYSTLWFRVFRADWRTIKKLYQCVLLEREIRSVTLRLSSIEDELELAREDYVGEAAMGERGRELGREIVRMASYRDALRTELDRLQIELAVLNGTL